MAIQSVARAVELLKVLDQAGVAGESLSALAEAIGVLPTTAHNLLKTLVELQFVGRDPATKHYVLGREARRLGQANRLEDAVIPIAQETVRSLRDQLGETVILTQYLRGKRRTLVFAESMHELKAGARIGPDDRLYETATGRTLLSWLDDDQRDDAIDRLGLPGERWPEAGSRQSLSDLLDQIRRQGVCRIERAAWHIHAVAVPVDISDVTLALGLYYPSIRHTSDTADEFERALLKASQDISRRVQAADLTCARSPDPDGM